MTFKPFLLSMGIGTGLAWITWLIVAFSIDPSTTSFVGFFVFFVALGVASCGTLTLAGTSARFLLQKEAIVSRLVGTAFRQSLLLTTLLLACLWLLSADWFRWWIVLFMILLLAVIETAWSSAHR